MIEGRPQIRAKRAIYDPQDGFLSRHFAANDSSADELVVLASLSEGRALTGRASPEEIASVLLTQPSCVAAVIKCGPQGALVATTETQKWIRAFPSPKVWKIGSGDVFSASFAHKWFIENSSALEAAWFASRMVSEYVSTRMEVFKADRMTIIRTEAIEAHSQSADHPATIPDATVYLAGPFFTTSQQWMVDEARFALRDLGFKVFSPIHEIGEGPPFEVAPADLFALEHSQLVFALVDGLDAGTIFEIGYARARDIPVVCLAESVESKALTMLLGSGCEVQNDFSTSVYAACWQLMNNV
jgi:nucleoside 2-deoxyribosyltransferase